MKVNARYFVSIFIFISTFTFIVLTIFYTKLEHFPKNEADDSTAPWVYFLETNVSRRYMTQMSACSLESAARHHPRSRVVVYKLGSAFDLHAPLLLSLRRNYANIRFNPLDPDQLFRGTPLQDENGSEDEMSQTILKSPTPEDHMSDVARAALLWKHGGIYLDTDVIVRRSLDAFTNTLGIESYYALERFVNTPVMIFEKNSEFLFKYMESVRYLFSVLSFIHVGPGPMLISHWLAAACGVTLLLSPLPLDAPGKCGGITVVPYHVFSEISYYTSWKLFLRPEVSPIDLSEAYVLHLSHTFTKGKSTAVGSGSHLDLIFKNNCPVVYEQIGATIFG